MVCLATSRPCLDLSVCLQPVACLSITFLSILLTSQSDCLRFFSSPHPPSFVGSLDSELWYRLDAELLLWLRQHRGRWAVSSAAFYHAERAPRVISSLTAESAHNQKLQTSLVSIQGFSLPCPARKEDS